jgi:hypothetical protein
MGKVWILDTETKGTGAHMVPLEQARKTPAPRGAPLVSPRTRRRGPAGDEEPRPPRTFKVVDVMTREVLAEGASARATVEALQDVDSVVDVLVSVWLPEARRWRLLTQGERKALWELRDPS